MITYFQPGFREIRRWSRRAALRFALLFKRRLLAKAETNLGLLGWQQAEFEGDARRHVEALKHLEKQQSALFNRAAAIAIELERIARERASAREVFDALRTELAAEREALRQPLEDLSRQAASMRERHPHVEKQARQIDAEFADTERLYNELLVVQPQTDKVRDQLMLLRDRLIALPNQRTDLHSGLSRMTAEIQERDEKIARIELGTREIDQRLTAARTAFEEKDKPLEVQQHALDKERAQAEKSADQLERGKGDPYRAIGSELADSCIAPLNQPEALLRVQELRQDVAEREAAIAASLTQSRQEDPVALRASLLVWGVLAIAALLLVLSLG